MDQTKLINAYIANLAERVKLLTLDSIMLNTQLALANETIAELTEKVEKLEKSAKKKAPPESGSGEFS